MKGDERRKGRREGKERTDRPRDTVTIDWSQKDGRGGRKGLGGERGRLIDSLSFFFFFNIHLAGGKN